MYCAYCGSWVEQVSYVPCASCAQPTNGSRPRAAYASSSPVMIVVFVALGGFLVLGVIGLLAAIAIPNLLTAMQRSKQKRTIADIRMLATAAEAYGTDNGKYPRAESMDELAPLLEPKYAAKLPRLDGWGNELRYRCLDEACTGYAITSSGADRVFEHVQADQYEERTTDDFNADLVWLDGKFIQRPEGVR